MPNETTLRLKLFSIWGGVLFVVQLALTFLGAYLFGLPGLLVGGFLALPIAALCGYMVAKGLLPTATSSATVIAAGVAPGVIASLLAMLFTLVTTGEFEFALPVLPSVAGIIGAFIAQKSGGKTTARR